MANIDFNLLLNGGVSSSLTNAFGSVGKKINGLQTNLKTLNQTTSKLNQFKRLSDQLKKFQTAMDGGGDAGAKAKTKFEQTKTTLAELSEELKKAGVNMDDLAGSEKRLAGQTDKLNTKLNKHQQVVAKQKAVQAGINKSRNMRQTAFSGGLTGIVAPVMALASPVMAAVNAEEKLAEVRKVANDLSEGELKKLSDDMLRMSTQDKIPMTYGEFMDIAAAGAQSNIGKTREELTEFARYAAYMGVAFDMSGGQAGQTMANWRSGMKLSQAEAVDLADAVNFLSNNMNATAPDLAEVIQRQGAVAKTAGLADHEVAALGAAFLTSGAPAEVAATGLKNFTNALVKGASTAGDARDYWEKIGMIPEDVAKRMQVDAEGTIKDVLTAMTTKLPKHELSAAVGEMFGEVSKGAIMPLLTNLENLEKAFGLVADKTQYSGSMFKEYEVRSQTTANNLKVAGNQLNALGIAFGSVLLPPLNKVLGAFGKLSIKVIELGEKYPGLTQAIVGGTAGIMAAGAAFNLLAGATKFAAGGIGEAFGVLKKISMIQLGPLGIAAIAIGGLVVALNELGVLTPMIEGFNTAFNAVMPGIKEAIGPGVETLKQMLKDLQDALKSFGVDVDLESWKGIGTALGELAGGGVLMLAEGFSGLVKAAKAVGDTVGGIIGSLSVGDYKSAADQFVSGMDPVLATIRGMAPGVYDVFDTVGKAIGTFAAAAITKFEDIVAGVKNIGPAIKANIDDKIEKAKAVIATIKTKFEETVNAVKAYLETIDLIEEGKKLIQSLIDGIKAKASDLIAEIRQIGTQIKDTLAEITPTSLFTDAKDYWGGKINSIFGKKAAGGLIQGGRPYLVGERGPELIVPSAGAKVIPSHHVLDYLRPAGLAGGIFPGGDQSGGGLSIFNMLSGGLGALLGNIVQGIAGPMAGGLFGLLGGGQGSNPSISIPVPGGQTINVTVHIPAGVSNPDQVRQAASDGVMNSIDGIKRAIRDIYTDERRLSFA